MNIINFASESSTESASGLAAFGVSWQALLIQALTFLLVVLVLKKFVIGKIYEILDARQAEIDSGLDATKKAKESLDKAQEDIDKILGDAREQAELIVSSAKSESADLVKSAEDKASKRAEAIITEAKSKLDNDVAKAKAELKEETARLIAEVSSVIIGQKLNTTSDSELIDRELEKRSAK